MVSKSRRVTPFASTYSIAGKCDLIAIAYAAHVGLRLSPGRIVQSGASLADGAREVTRRPITWTLVAIGAFLVIWHRPFFVPSDVHAGHQAAAGPSAVVINGRFSPEWLRVAPGGCATLLNEDAAVYTVTVASGTPVLEKGSKTKVCFVEAGVHRVRISDVPYSGGFVIVDPALAR